MNYLSRKSNIELLRLFCIFGILVMHILGRSMSNLSFANREIDLLFNSFFNCGVTIFVLISGYFGIHFSWKKIFKLHTMVLVYSIIYTLVSILPTGLAIQDVFITLFPILSNRFWFMTSYFILCFLSPYINKFINMVNKKECLSLTFTLLFFFSIIPTVTNLDFTFDNGKGIVNMILIYIIGRCIRLGYIHLSKKQSVVFGLASILITFVLMSFISYFQDKVVLGYFFNDYSILVIVSSVCIFNIFRSFDITSPYINRLSKHVLAVYILEWPVMDLIDKFINLNDFGQSPCFFLVFFAYAFLVFASCILVDEVRVLLFDKLEDKVIDKIIAALKLQNNAKV